MTNKDSATISIIDPGTFAVVKTVALPRGSEPHGIVMNAAGNAFVALEGVERIVKLSANGDVLLSVAAGNHPRHLALSANESTLLVASFISPPLPLESTAKPKVLDGEARLGGQILRLAPATLGLKSAIALRHSDKPDTTASGRGIPNYLGAPAISPDGLSAWSTEQAGQHSKRHLAQRSAP